MEGFEIDGTTRLSMPCGVFPKYYCLQRDENPLTGAGYDCEVIPSFPDIIGASSRRVGVIHSCAEGYATGQALGVGLAQLCKLWRRHNAFSS